MGTDLLVPYEVRPQDIQVKRSAASLEGGMGVIQSSKDPMEFWIIGGVTGIVDEVNDIVEPGAYTATLKKRRPKIIKDHDWTHRLGKVLEIFEAAPGDKRLPKTTSRGEPWPAAAGALMAKVRLFDTKEGRDAAVRWAEDGVEQEFSIGYVARKAVKSAADGIRRIKVLDCFEISDVLWGAMPLAGPLPEGLATKMIAGLAMESKGGTAAVVDDDEEFENPESTGLFDEVPDMDQGAGIVAPVDDAGASVDDGAGVDEDEDEEFDDRPEVDAMGDAAAEQDDDDLDDLDDLDEDIPGMERKYNTSPVGTPGGRQNWVDKVGGLPKYIRAIAHALIREGKPKSVAIRIAIGTVKRWARGGGNVSEKTRAKAAKAVAEWEAKKARSRTKSASDVLASIEGGALRMERDVRVKGYDPEVESGADAGTVAVDEAATPPGMQPVDKDTVTNNGALMPEDEVIESKMYGGCLPGSYEERQKMVLRAAWEALRGAPIGGEGQTPDRYEWSEVSVVSMWDDRAVVARYKWGPGETETEHFEVPYTISGDEALLGDFEEVRLVVNTVVESIGDAEEETYLPFADDVEAIAVSMKTLLGGLDTKAGRVLSGVNATRLRAAVENLLGVLSAAGVDITPPDEPEGDKPVGAPTGTPPVEAKDRRGGGEVIDQSEVPTPADYLSDLSAFLAEHS